MTRNIDWLGGLRRYLTVSAFSNAVWEPVQLPLYSIWDQATLRDKLVAVLHCTAGDILIALSAWAFAVVVVGRSGWPAEGFRRVALLAIASGLAYTVFSEWLNTAIRHSWAYSRLMPVVPGLGVGLSPLMQWLLVPSLALWAARGKGVHAEAGKPHKPELEARF